MVTPFFYTKTVFMKKTIILSIVLCHVLLTHAANNAGVNNVFGKYLLSRVEYETSKEGSSYVLDYENGKLAKITEYYYEDGKDDGMAATYTFDYSKLDENKVTMHCKGDDLDYGDDYRIEMTLNEDGFVSKAVCRNHGEWYEFTYNADKQLECMKQYWDDEDDVEVTRMTYSNGDLTKVVVDNEDIYQITYTSDKVSTPIENITGLMYDCDWLWGIDLDEYNFVYMAGLLGKAPAHLPISYSYNDGKYSDVYEFEWELDENCCPTKCSSGYEAYRYYWIENGIATNIAELQGNMGNSTDYYTVNGQKISRPRKGINIIRLSNGETHKVLLKQ